MGRFFALALAVTGAATASAQSRQPLDIYVVDVEGGNATLFVAPSGESLLIDTGNGGAAAVRDADRIMAAVPGAFIANTVDQQPATMPIEAIAPPAPGTGAAPPAHDGATYWIKISALRDGTFTVTNARNGFAKTYSARSR